MIKDDNEMEFDSMPIKIPPGASREFNFITNARSGYFVRTKPVENILVEVRADPGDAWQNVATDPLDLTPYEPDEIKLYFRVTNNTDGADELALQPIQIRP